MAHFTSLNVLLGAFSCLAASACARPASDGVAGRGLDDVAGDVRIHAYVFGDPGAEPTVRRLVVTLERWNGSAGETYRSCPSFPKSTATLNGHAMEVVTTGGEWSDHFGCSLPTFTIDAAEVTDGFDLPETTIAITDETSTLLMRSSNVFIAPHITWQVPSDGVLHPGDRASLAIVPEAKGLILDDVTFLPDGAGEPQRIDTPNLDLSSDGLSFEVPNLTPGKGLLSIAGGNRPLFGAAVHACEGVTTCYVERAACADTDCTDIPAVSESLDAEVLLPTVISP